MELTCAPIKNMSSSPKPLTMDILTYKRKDSATDVSGMKARAAFLRASDALPIAATAPGSMNITSDIRNAGFLQGLEGWLYVEMIQVRIASLRCTEWLAADGGNRVRSAKLDALCTKIVFDIVGQTTRLEAKYD